MNLLSRHLFLLAFLLLSLGSSTFAQSKKDIELLNKGNQQLAKSDYKGVIKTASEYIKRNPAQSEGYLMRGIGYSKLDDYANAIKDYNKSIKLVSNYYLSYQCRAIAYRETKEVEKAISDYNVALKYWSLEEDKDSADYYFMIEGRGACKLMKRDFKGAEADYRITYWPDTTGFNANVNLGYVYMETGKYDEAYYHMKKALDADPENPVIMNNLGYLCNLKGEYAEAIPYFNKAIETDSKWAYAYSNRGLARYKTGDVKGGLEDINYSIKLNPENSYAYKNLAVIQIGSGNTTEACATLEKALKLGYSTQYGYEVQELYNKNCK